LGAFSSFPLDFPLSMVYYAQDSAQFIAWEQLTDLTNSAAFTTEKLCLAAQYEAFKVWGEYMRRHGNLNEAQAKELIQVVIDGWIFLQVARRIDWTSSSDLATASNKSESRTDSDAGRFIVPVDYQSARRKAKQEAMDVLNQILEFDVARLLHHFDRFLSHKAE